MTGWSWAQPWVLVAGPLVALAVALARRGRPEAVPGGAAVRADRRRGPTWLAALGGGTALVAGWLAWAGPRHGEQLADDPRRGIAIMHVIDTSESMAALDFAPGDQRLERLEGAVRVLQAFAGERTRDLQGLMVFGDQVFTLAPLVGDPEVIRELAAQLETGMAGQATALGDAIALGVKRLRNAPTESRVLVVLSDGKNTAGRVEPIEAARFAREDGVRVYTIGIGGTGPAPFRVQTFFGERIRNVTIEMDAETLTAVAEATGGRYFHADHIEELAAVYQEIDRLETAPFEARVAIAYEPHYLGLLGAALAALLLWQLAEAWAWRRFPAP